MAQSFATEAEAKQFLVERIAARAVTEGSPLSDDERHTLEFTESPPASSTDPEVPDLDDEEFEERMAGLLSRAFESDRVADAGAPQAYRSALTALESSDHYISWIAGAARLRPPLRGWERVAKHVFLFVVLFVPALVATLMAVAALWAAIGSPPRTREEVAQMSLVVFMFGGFGAFLFALWLRERRP